MTVLAPQPMQLGPQRFTGEFIRGKRVVEGFPVARARITHYWGDWYEEGYNLPFDHTGEDYAPMQAGRDGDDILHCGPGKETGPDPVGKIWRIDRDGVAEGRTNGNAVAVFGPFPYMLFYLHLRDNPHSYGHSVGDYLDRGDYVGAMGDTGAYTNGAHLHFGLWQIPAPAWWGLIGTAAFSGKDIDPRPFFVEQIAPPAPKPTNGWVEPNKIYTAEEWEIDAVMGYHDLGNQVGTAPGDMDARAKIEDDGRGLVKVLEVRKRL